MRYPTLTRSRTKAIVEQLTGDTDYEPNLALELSWVGKGEALSVEGIQSVAQLMRTFADDDGKDWDNEAIEAIFSGHVHHAMRDLPVVALDDPGFWRYLSISDFWWFIARREAKAIKNGNAMTYVDGGRECVPFRMYLRGQAIRSGDDYSLAGAIPNSTDFWRSHIVRVKTGTAPPLARAFAQLQAEQRMVSDDVRPFAKKVNRLWTNIVFNVWDEPESDALLRHCLLYTSPSPRDRG